MARIARSCAALMFGAMLAVAATPPAVEDMLSAAVGALANGDAKAFLGHFDPKTPGLVTIAHDVSALVATDGASSNVEVMRDEGDDHQRKLDIDWVLRAGPSRQKHVTVKMTIEHQGKAWKITSFAPADLFTIP